MDIKSFFCVGSIHNGKYRIEDDSPYKNKLGLLCTDTTSMKKCILDYINVNKESSMSQERINDMFRVSHSNVARYIDKFIEGNWLCYVYEYIEGDSLLEVLEKEGGKLPAAKAVDIALQIADALLYMHNQNPKVLHLAVNPSHIIIQPDGTAKLVSHNPITSKMFRLSDVCVSYGPSYCAVEQLYYCPSYPENESTDIYGLGATLHHLVTGLGPNYCSRLPIRKVDPKLPIGLDYAISKCLYHLPDLRYQSCDELIRDLKDYKKLSLKKLIWMFKNRKRRGID